MNAHTKVVLGIRLEFLEPVDDDVPMDEDRLQAGSDVDSDCDTEEVDALQAVEEAWHICYGGLDNECFTLPLYLLILMFFHTWIVLDFIVWGGV